MTTRGQALSDLPEFVRDSRLEVIFQSDGPHSYTIHPRIANRRGVHDQGKWLHKKTLGAGAQGAVDLQTNDSRRLGGQLPQVRAVKKIWIAAEIQETSKLVRRELEAIFKFSQQGYYSELFVHSYGWYMSEGYIYIAMEYYELGDLQKYLQSQCASQRLPENDVLQIASQVLDALFLMHQEGFSHRDLKPANILIKAQPPMPWWVKLGDFGISKRGGEISTVTAIRGTPGFMPPELHGFGPQDEASLDTRDRSYAYAIDMWCFGETVFRTLTGQPIFRNVRQLAAYCDERLPFPRSALKHVNASDSLVEFLASIAVPDPSKRLTAETASQHPWIESQWAAVDAQASRLSAECTNQPNYYSRSRESGINESTQATVSSVSNTKAGEPVSRAGLQTTIRASELTIKDATASWTNALNGSSASAVESQDHQAQVPPEVPEVSVEVPGHSLSSSPKQAPSHSAPSSVPTSDNNERPNAPRVSEYLHPNQPSGQSASLLTVAGTPSPTEDQPVASSITDLMDEVFKAASEYYVKGDSEQVGETLRLLLELAESDVGRAHLDTLVSMDNMVSVPEPGNDGLQVTTYRYGNIFQSIALEPDPTPIVERKQVTDAETHPLMDQGQDDIAPEARSDFIAEHAEVYQHFITILYSAESHLGAHKPVVEKMRLLGVSLQMQGAFEQAEPIFRDVYRYHKRIRNDRSEVFYSNIADLACTLLALYRRDEAEQLYSNYLPSCRVVLGIENDVTKSYLQGLANSLLDSGRLLEAEKLDGGAMDVFKEAHGDESSKMALDMLQHGYRLSEKGQDLEAANCLRQALRISNKVFGEHSAKSLEITEVLCSTLCNIGDFPGIETLQRQIFQSRCIKLGKEHPYTLDSMHSLAMTLCHDLQQLFGAEQMLLKLVSTRKRILGHSHVDTLKAMSDLGHVLIRNADDDDHGRISQALHVYKSLYGLAEEEFGVENRLYRDAARELRRCSERLANLEKQKRRKVEQPSISQQHSSWKYD